MTVSGGETVLNLHLLTTAKEEAVPQVTESIIEMNVDPPVSSSFLLDLTDANGTHFSC
jgi:hypothetical protein